MNIYKVYTYANANDYYFSTYRKAMAFVKEYRDEAKDLDGFCGTIKKFMVEYAVFVDKIEVE